MAEMGKRGKEGVRWRGKEGGRERGKEGELTSLASIEGKVIVEEGDSEEGEADVVDANPEGAGGQGEFVKEGGHVCVHREEEEGESGEGEQEKMSQTRVVVEG